MYIYVYTVYNPIRPPKSLAHCVADTGWRGLKEQLVADSIAPPQDVNDHWGRLPSHSSRRYSGLCGGIAWHYEYGVDW